MKKYTKKPLFKQSFFKICMLLFRQVIIRLLFDLISNIIYLKEDRYGHLHLVQKSG